MGAAITKTLARAVLAGSILAVATLAWGMRGEAVGFTYAGGSFDLKIDSEATYNGADVLAATWSIKDLVPGVDKFFNFDDIKPGDWGENTISLHAKKEPLWVCLTFFNLLNGENGINEPESHVDNTPGTGELTSALEFFAWQDDGDNIFEVGEKPIFGTTTQAAKDVLAGKTYPVYDYKTGTPVPKNGTKYFGIYWCAGDLSVNVATAAITCQGQSLGNEYQTDSMKVDVRLTAISAKDEPKFQCNKVKTPKPPPPPPGEICEDLNVTIVNNNSSTVTNTTTSSSNTGGNTAQGGAGGAGGSGGTGGAGGAAVVQTGGSSASATTINVINTNIFNWFFNR